MITYIFKSSLSLIILFGLYWFLLRKEKLFVFNRFFLVASVVFSLIVPFISIPVNLRVTPQLEEIIPSGDFVIPEISTSEFNTVTTEAYSDQTTAENQPEAINFSTVSSCSLYFRCNILSRSLSEEHIFNNPPDQII